MIVTSLSLIKPIELLNLVDESIFALTYYTVVLRRLYDYLGGKV